MMKASATNQTTDNWYVASLVVQAKPEKLDEVKSALLAKTGTEIFGEKVEEGKLVVVMEADYQPDLVEKMEAVKEIKGVVSVSLVYNYQDEQ
ncbi:chaperone NapD [Glaesserella sp.]|uniref:chaperone NapD n=1 Tax=Glaesserella sp. TaxID=2094731 RepID=UPI00359F68A5